jgi:hypothetical protein
MPRAGGEAAKLGDHYEAIWTVDSLLDSLSGEAVLVQPEPFDEEEAEGIEFIKVLDNGETEYHSVKRQKVGESWSLNNLTATSTKGRSILGDLFSKLARNEKARSVFVSQTGANELLELCDRARRCKAISDWIKQLESATHLREGFETRVLPLCNKDREVAFDRLKRMRVVAFDEREMTKRVEQKTRFLLRRQDGGAIDAGEVRRLLGEFITMRLGEVIQKNDVLTHLSEHGFSPRPWASDKALLERVAQLNETYLIPIRSQFVNKKPIPRMETKVAVSK